MSQETHTAPDQLSAEVEAALAALTRLSDAELWEIVSRPSAPEAAERLADLNDRRQREGLSDADERLADDLAGRLDIAMVMRAQAVALLHARGHDVSDLVARA
jgi:hypothetical protein